VAQRLLQKFKNAKVAFKNAKEAKDDKATAAAKDEMDALILFKTDMSTYHRAYTFLSQVFDYGNTDLEKRAIFYKHLVRLLKFGQERDEVDLSQVVLTHHTLKDRGKQPMPLNGGEYPQLDPLTEIGSGAVQEKKKAYLSEIIEKVNDLFKGELTDNDKLVYVNNVIKGKLLESPTLAKQAANNTKEQFASSPDLKQEIMNAIISALDAHTEMSTQALNSEDVRNGIREILIGSAGLYESLRKQSA
jgi:type I restriction enzyme R subunit